MRKFSLLLLLPLASACGADAPQNAAVIADNAAEAQPANMIAADQTAAPMPRIADVGPLRIRYDATLLAPVPAKVALPPDWKTQVDGLKLVGRDRAELLGKAECMYGQSGEASRCNVLQEAGLSFAALDIPFVELVALLPPDQREDIDLAGMKGISWLIGAEGEGAEYIALPADEGSILVVRQFRATENLDDDAIGDVLNGLKLDGIE